MIKASEYCAVGHPDRTCDYIASYILDRYLEKAPWSRVALEVQLKNNHCTIAGEISSEHYFTNREIADFVRDAINEVGYTKEYQEEFGRANTICADDVEVVSHISKQSEDISRGVNNEGWGDQGIFWGLAVNDPATGYMPKDYYLARLIGNKLYKLEKKGLGIDIKTLVTLEDDKCVQCVVAVPSIYVDKAGIDLIEQFVREHVGTDAEVIINGTGTYRKHGPIADCGTTGRKLVVDFYGGNSRIGGGTTWGKDSSKADVTLNIYARHKALQYMKDNNLPLVQCSISCCIGKPQIRISYFDDKNQLLHTCIEERAPSEIISELDLRSPKYAKMCMNGMFGYESIG